MQRLLILLLIAGITFNCAGGDATDTQEETSDVNTEESSEVAEATMVNPNLASKEDLVALPQISEELAQQIIDQRPFLGIKAFHEVLSAAGLDASAIETLFVNCFVPLNLNTTPEEDFLMVPGVGKKMAHEFEEYRPYKKVAQFRREMGKYVDEAEIARYEQYVFVPIELNTATEEEILALPGVGKKMAHEFEEYRPYVSMEQFRREIGKYVDEKELARLERFVMLDTEGGSSSDE